MEFKIKDLDSQVERMVDRVIQRVNPVEEKFNPKDSFGNFIRKRR